MTWETKICTTIKGGGREGRQKRNPSHVTNPTINARKDKEDDIVN